jgi:hypothetical protein
LPLSRGTGRLSCQSLPYPAWFLANELDQVKLPGAGEDTAWKSPEVTEEAQELLERLYDQKSRVPRQMFQLYIGLLRRSMRKIPADRWLKYAFFVVLEFEEGSFSDQRRKV